MDKIPNWSEYFMAIARTVSIRSKDPNTKVGAVLVDKDNRIIGTGYNGFPQAMIETPELWQRPIKYEYVVHAEVNCILHSTSNTKNSSLFVTMYPCKDCAKLIVNAGVKRIIYADDKYKNEISEHIFNSCGINVRQLNNFSIDQLSLIRYTSCINLGDRMYTLKPGVYSVCKTSEEWFNEFYKDRVVIYDPDGWDRSPDGWQYSWFEETITRSEFEKRLCASTIQWNFGKL